MEKTIDMIAARHEKNRVMQRRAATRAALATRRTLMLKRRLGPLLATARGPVTSGKLAQRVFVLSIFSYMPNPHETSLLHT